MRILSFLQESIPNPHGNNENLDTKELIKCLEAISDMYNNNFVSNEFTIERIIFAFDRYEKTISESEKAIEEDSILTKIEKREIINEIITNDFKKSSSESKKILSSIKKEYSTTQGELASQKEKLYNHINLVKEIEASNQSIEDTLAKSISLQTSFSSHQLSSDYHKESAEELTSSYINKAIYIIYSILIGVFFYSYNP